MLNILKQSIAGALLASVAGFTVALPTSAKAETDFYQGKTLRVIVGYGPGGGYDLYGRIFAQFIGKFIPGNPTVIVQNMPGAGSKVAAKYMYNVAPKDGTFFGSLSQNLAYDSVVLGTPKSEFDPAKLKYIGRLTSSVDLGLGIPSSSFKSIEDAKKREIVVGATGPASTSYLLPAALNKHGGTKFKIVTGYKGSSDILLAVERKEVDMVSSINMSIILAKYPTWISKREAPIMYQGGLKRHALLPHVPAIPELGIGAKDKALLSAIAAGSEIGRSINTTPGVPPERLALLRAAFDKMMKDPDVLAYMAERKAVVDYMSGQEVDEIALQAAEMSPETLEFAKALVPKKK